MTVVEKHNKYLGMPLLFSGSKKESFQAVKDRVWKKLKGWKEKRLSKAGKEVLLKSVAQSIPTYLTSVYKFSSGIIDDINSAMSRFWWGSEPEAKRIHWHSWEVLCKPKSMGG